MIKQCLNCKKDFRTFQSRIKIEKGKFCSKKCSDISFRGKRHSKKTEFKIGHQPSIKSIEQFKKAKGDKHPNWKGKNASYISFHHWLKYNFGKASRCENFTCVFKNPKRFEYALKKGFRHDHFRENYIMLCPSCHRKYDYGNLILTNSPTP